jgi:hypothetical protein
MAEGVVAIFQAKHSVCCLLFLATAVEEVGEHEPGVFRDLLNRIATIVFDCLQQQSPLECVSVITAFFE